MRSQTASTPGIPLKNSRDSSSAGFDPVSRPTARRMQGYGLQFEISCSLKLQTTTVAKDSGQNLRLC